MAGGFFFRMVAVMLLRLMFAFDGYLLLIDILFLFFDF